MGSFVPNVGDGCGNGRRQLPLYSGVPSIHGREPVIEWANKRVEASRQERQTVGPYALRLICREFAGDRINAARIGDGVAVARRQGTAECCRWIERERPLRKEKGCVEVLSI